MKCKKCEAELAEDANFCEKCGWKVEKEYDNPLQQCRQVNRRYVLLASIAVGIIILILIIWNQQRKTINLNEFITVNFDGYDTIGYAYISFDETSFIKTVAEKKNYNTTEDSLAHFLYNLTGIDNINSIETNVSPNTDLSNGDKVTLSISYDEALEKALGLKLKVEKQEWEVSGLEAIKEVDPFDEITVEFNGIAPKLNVDIKNNSKDAYLSSLEFSTEAANNIMPGDKITVKLQTSEEAGLSNGYKFTKNTKEYTCESADAYVTNFENINEDTLDLMKNETTDHIEDYFANNTSYIQYDSLNYVGGYIVYPKSYDNYYWDANTIYIVYSTTVTSLEGKFDPTLVYEIVKFTNLVQMKDGTQTFDLDGSMVYGKTNLKYSFFTTLPGYTDGRAMYSDLITAAKADHEYSISENLKQFGE